MGNKTEELVITSEPIAHLHNVYMPIEVSHSAEIDNLCNLLRTISENDTVVVYLGNYGGDCHAGQRLINAMADCRAHIVVITDAPCYSMAALIAISGNSLQMHQGSLLKFHNYSGGARGKGGELMEEVKQHDIWLKKQQLISCFPFLSKAEINKLEHDQDIWIHWDDPSIPDRLERHIKYQEKNRRRIRLGGI